MDAIRFEKRYTKKQQEYKDGLISEAMFVTDLSIYLANWRDRLANEAQTVLDTLEEGK